MAVSITDESLQAMADAIMTGELAVTMPDGSSVRYRTIDELTAAYNWAVQTRASQQSGTNSRRSIARFK